MKSKFKCIILLLFAITSSPAQVTLNWTHFLEQRSKPANCSDPIVVNASGNVFIPYSHANSVISSSTTSIVTLKGNNGNEIFKYNLPQTLSTSSDNPSGLAIDGANNIYAGFTYQYDNNYDFEDGRLFKYNSTLVPQWDRYNYSTTPPGSDLSCDLAFAPGSLYWLVQRADSGMCVSKYTTAGILAWRKFVAGNPSNIRTDAAGNFYVLGNKNNAPFSKDINVSKYSYTGVLQWEVYLHAENNALIDSIGDFTTDAAGNVYIIGSGQRTTTGFDIITAKYNSSGILQWSRLISGTGNHDDYGKAIAVDTAGNIYASGSIYETNSGVYSDNIIIRKYSPTGTVLATRKYNYGTGVNESPSDLKVTRAGKVYITGRTGVSYLFQQYSISLGLPEYTDFYTPDTASLATGAETMEAKGDYLVIKNNKAYVLGEFYFNASCCPNDFYIESFVRKYSIPSPAPRIADNKELDTSIIKLYPNPATDILHFEIDSPIQQLSVYDLTGRVVLHFNTSIENELDVSTLISGLYIIQLQTKDGLMTSRFVKK